MNFIPVLALPALSCDVGGSIRPGFTAYLKPQDGKVGTPFSFWVTTDPGADGTYTYAGLPAGLSGNSAGVISGTPSAAGVYTVTITLTSGAAVVASQSFTFTILA